jgi:hypothetical protein
LSDGILASSHGGEIAVREMPVKEGHRRLVPEAALYRVTLALQQPYAPDRPQILRGQVVLFGEARSWLGEFARRGAALFMREANSENAAPVLCTCTRLKKPVTATIS